jgi:hypothetical protein
MSFEIRYADNRGQPVKMCPECGEDFTEEGGITLELSDGVGSQWEVPARLDGDGFIIDPGQVGQHSATFCGCCNALLITYAIEAVFEDGVRVS